MPAILIAAAITAGAGIASSKIQSNAAKKAAETQVGASNVAANNTMDSTARALDYVNAARSAPPPPSQFPAYNSLMGGQKMGMPGGMPQPNTLKPGVPGQGPLGLPGGYQTLMGPQPGQSQVQPGLVMLQSPDGREQKAVPEGEAQRWLAMGAKRIG